MSLSCFVLEFLGPSAGKWSLFQLRSLAYGMFELHDVYVCDTAVLNVAQLRHILLEAAAHITLN